MMAKIKITQTGSPIRRPREGGGSASSAYFTRPEEGSGTPALAGMTN